MQVLLTNPEVDLLTYYLLAWTNNILKEPKSKTNKYYHLKRERATRKKFEGILKKRPVDLVLLCGHGTSEAVAGNNENILDMHNDDLLAGKTIHAISCQSADKLGPDAVKKGAKAYIGYKRDFITFLDNSKQSTKPLKDDTASLFLKPAFTAPKILLKGGTPEKAVQATKKAYNKSIRDAINSDVQSDADQFINWLLWNRDNLTLCQNS